MIAVDARENQIFLHIFTSPCFMQNQNVLILITVPTFLLITDHHSAVDRDDAFLHQVPDLMAVCDNDHCCTAPVDLLQKSHDLHRIVGIQISRGLIGKQDLRAIDQCPGNRHALLFSTGELMREKLILGRKAYHL